MPSKRRPVGDSLIGATISFVGATPRKREEGSAGVFRLCERSVLALLSGHHDNLFARQQNRAQGENRNEAKEQRPFVIINARRSQVHLRALRAGVPFLGLLALSTGAISSLWRTNARDGDVQSAFGGEGLVQKHVHALLLSGGTDAVSGQRYARRRYQEHADARVNSGKLQVRGIAGIRKLVRKANIRFPGMKPVSDGVEAFALVN